MYEPLRVGSVMGATTLGRAVAGSIEKVRLDELIRDERALICGIVGAFTPPCSQQHVPDFVRNAARLRASGYERLIVAAPNDPFTLAAWAEQMDPEGRVTFLSDGNLDLAQSLGVVTRHPEFFIGHSVRRYLAVLNDRLLERLSVEPVSTVVSSTRASALLDVASAA